MRNMGNQNSRSGGSSDCPLGYAEIVPRGVVYDSWILAGKLTPLFCCVLGPAERANLLRCESVRGDGAPSSCSIPAFRLGPR